MSKIRICLDAGHGGKDSGAVNGSRFEKDDNLDLTLKVGKLLQAKGIEVYYTRIKDIYDPTVIKVKKSNEFCVDYFISIHRNSSLNKLAHGSEVLINDVKGSKFEMAKNIQSQLVDQGLVDRGVKVNPCLMVLKRTKAQSLLVEVGFISNADDNKLFDEKIKTFAKAIANGILQTLDI